MWHLNSNNRDRYGDGYRTEVSLEVLRGSDMETEPHVKVIVTDVGLSLKMYSCLSVISD